MGCRFLLQGIFPTQGLNPVSPSPALAGEFSTTGTAFLLTVLSCPPPSPARWSFSNLPGYTAPFSSPVDPPPIFREGKLKALPAWLALRLCLSPHPCFSSDLVQFAPLSSSYQDPLASLLVPRLPRGSLPRGLLFFYSAQGLPLLFI